MNREDLISKRASAYAYAELAKIGSNQTIWFTAPLFDSEDLSRAYMQGAKDVEDNPAWRMCEDELPYPNEDVLVAFDNGDRGIGYYEGIGDWYVNGIGVVDNIVAWLPLPKFYTKTKKS